MDVMAAYFNSTAPSHRKAADIAGILNRSVNSVIIKANRVGLKFTLFSSSELKAIRSYYTETPPGDLNLYLLSKQMGRPRSSICMVAKEMGLTDTRRPKRTLCYGEVNSQWKGDAVSTTDSGRKRARHRYKGIGQCEHCHAAKAIDRHHIDGNTLRNSRSNILFLCRRCHMALDGRLQCFTESALAPRAVLPPSPCIICGKPYKPLRKGRCHSCNEYMRRHGCDKPAGGK